MPQNKIVWTEQNQSVWTKLKLIWYKLTKSNIVLTIKKKTEQEFMFVQKCQTKPGFVQFFPIEHSNVHEYFIHLYQNSKRVVKNKGTKRANAHTGLFYQPCCWFVSSFGAVTLTSSSPAIFLYLTMYIVRWPISSDPNRENSTVKHGIHDEIILPKSYEF